MLIPNLKLLIILSSCDVVPNDEICYNYESFLLFNEDSQNCPSSMHMTSPSEIFSRVLFTAFLLLQMYFDVGISLLWVLVTQFVQFSVSGLH